jgi:hypothetical protein
LDHKKLIDQFMALPIYDIAVYTTQSPAMPFTLDVTFLSPDTLMNFIKQHDCIWTC